SMTRMDLAVRSGYRPLFRYHPGEAEDARPFRLDSRPPTLPVADFLRGAGRFAVPEQNDPQRARMLWDLEQRDVDERWRYYEQLAGIERTVPPAAVTSPAATQIEGAVGD